MSAVQKVLAVPELLEAVLINVPLLDLVIATTVCHGFYDTISSSMGLRKRLRDEPMPLFACLCLGQPDTEDICNVDQTTPWFFRTPVDHGIVIFVRLEGLSIQTFIPNDRTSRIQTLDCARTEVSIVKPAKRDRLEVLTL